MATTIIGRLLLCHYCGMEARTEATAQDVTCADCGTEMPMDVSEVAVSEWCRSALTAVEALPE